MTGVIPNNFLIFVTQKSVISHFRVEWLNKDVGGGRHIYYVSKGEMRQEEDRLT